MNWLSLPDTLNLFIQVLSFFMLMMGLGISMVSTIQQMIFLFQLQSATLTIVVVLTAWQTSFLSWLIFAPIPLLLALLIKPILVQATVPEEQTWFDRIRRIFDPFYNKQAYYQAEHHALRAWLKPNLAGTGGLLRMLADLGLVVLAFILAYNLQPSTSSAMLQIEVNNLAITFSLLLLGLSILTNRPDLIAQVIGLLVMEQGMFLAVLRMIARVELAPYFILALVLYIVITLTILVVLLPKLHQISGSIQIDDQKQLKG